MKKMKEKVKEVTEPRNRLFWTMNKMVEELNPKIHRWRDGTTPWTPLPICF